MSVEENKAVVRRYFEECWNKGDLAVIDECLAPDVSLGDVKHVREDWTDAISRWLTGLPDFRYHVDLLIAEGDIVAARTQFTATHRGVVNPGTRVAGPTTRPTIDT